METEFEQWYQTLKKEIDDEVKDLAAMLDKLDIWIAKTKETKTIDRRPWMMKQNVVKVKVITSRALTRNRIKKEKNRLAILKELGR